MKSNFGPLMTALFGSALWGISGTASQVLFQVYGFPTIGLAMLRSLIAGLIILLITRPKWPGKDQSKLFMFAILGIIPSQIFFYITIAASNIVTALLLQFLFLPMVFLYEAFSGKFKLSPIRSGVLTLTMIGTLMVILTGSGGVHLSVTPLVIICGILSAFGVAYYNLASKPLTAKYGSWSITGWSFLITGLLLLLPGGWTIISTMQATWVANIAIVAALIISVAILGTLLAYGLIIKANMVLTSTEVSIATTTEPVFGAFTAYLVFGSLLSGLQYLGGALMILSVIALQLTMPKGK